jgi:hypothetical protein
LKKHSDDTKFTFSDGKVITRHRPGLAHAKSLAGGFLKQRRRHSDFTGSVSISIEGRHMCTLHLDAEGDITLEEEDA